MGSIEEPKIEVDLSHHLGAFSRARHPSALKELIKYMGVEGMISLGGGLPHQSLFPFQKATIESYPAEIEIDDTLDLQNGPLDEIVLSKAKQSGQLMDLVTAMQYGGGTGDFALLKWAKEFTQLVFQPAFDFEILAHCGNTDGWSKVVRLLTNPGDYILCEEYTFSTEQANWIPRGCKAAPVPMDAHGLRADKLDELLNKWGVTHPGVKKPNLLNIVPVGSNPSGTTIQEQRRKEIYDVCVKHDVIICEDDPYSFLQYPEYIIGSETKKSDHASTEDFISSLAPSFLKLDYQGRVIRLDSFSKTIGPGLRLGYFVCNKLFRAKLLEASQVETQSPSGWSQAVLLGLLGKWGIQGYLKWLSNLRDQYQIRRDWMCTAISTVFNLKSAATTANPKVEGLVAYSKASSGTGSKPIFSFVPPTGGMFIWARFDYTSSPRFQELSKDAKVADPEFAFTSELWVEFAKNLVLVTPGSYYIPWEGKEKVTTRERGAEEGVGHFRLAFSSTSKADMEAAIQRMSHVISIAWGLDELK